MILCAVKLKGQASRPWRLLCKVPFEVAKGEAAQSGWYDYQTRDFVAIVGGEEKVIDLERLVEWGGKT